MLGRNYKLKMLQRILFATAKNLDSSTMHIAEDRVAAVLDFTDEEWESLKALREADGVATTTTTVDDIIGALGMENKIIEGTINEGAV